MSLNHYIQFHRNRRRQKYLDERAKQHKDISYHALDNKNGEQFIVDTITDVESEAVSLLMVERLANCINYLSEKDLELLRALFFNNKSERQWSRETGIPQKTINDRKRKILQKLKKLLEY